MRELRFRWWWKEGKQIKYTDSQILDGYMLLYKVCNSNPEFYKSVLNDFEKYKINRIDIKNNTYTAADGKRYRLGSDYELHAHDGQ